MEIKRIFMHDLFICFSIMLLFCLSWQWYTIR